ncbi:MAG: hypothetical protein Q7S02_02100 [bacterium]|nr:hypothetical protein [bacterium]
MKIVHVLHERWFNSNGAAFLFPLRFHQRRLRERGIALRFFTEATSHALACDVLCVSSKFFRTWWDGAGGTRVEEFLQAARKYTTAILWFDISDSTGTTQFRVLPYVDRYCKGQLLRDRTQYRERYYGSRIFSDFAHRQFGVHDPDAGPPHLNHAPTDDQLKKVATSWNSGLAHYGNAGVRLSRCWHLAPWAPRWYPSRWTSPKHMRAIAVSCRIGTRYDRNTIAEPRRRIQSLLQRRGIQTGKLDRRTYVAELRQSRIAVSPFGLGEITLRDFEIILCGAAMMKQDMSHVETWPNLWDATQYLPFRWDLADFDAQLDWACSNPRHVVALACEAQAQYHGMLRSQAGYDAFCDRFTALIMSVV